MAFWDNSSSSMAACIYFYTAWMSIYVLFLPVFLLVLYVGLQQRSSGSAASASDIFTLNITVVEVLGVLGSVLLTLASYTGDFAQSMVGLQLFYTASCGQIMFHIVVCAERFLAVVHPVTYRRLKRHRNQAAVRNVCIAAAWLLSVGLACYYNLRTALFDLFTLLIIVLMSLLCIGFFCVKVLCALLRPGPGEGGGDRRQGDKSKRKAFLIMAIITVILVLKFSLTFASYVVFFTRILEDSEACLVSVSSQWVNIPSSLVLPVLFLLRQNYGKCS